MLFKINKIKQKKTGATISWFLNILFGFTFSFCIIDHRINSQSTCKGKKCINKKTAHSRLHIKTEFKSFYGKVTSIFTSVHLLPSKYFPVSRVRCAKEYIYLTLSDIFCNLIHHIESLSTPMNISVNRSQNYKINV